MSSLSGRGARPSAAQAACYPARPDKLCDQVSGAIVDRFLSQGSSAGIVAECGVASGVLLISARHASRAGLAIPGVAGKSHPRHRLLARRLRRRRLRHLPAEQPEGFYRRLAANGQMSWTDLGVLYGRTDRAAALGRVLACPAENAGLISALICT